MWFTLVNFAEDFLYSKTYACTWIDFKLQLLLRAGDIHANPGPCYNGGVNFWQFIRQSDLNQRPSQNGYPVSSRDFPRISDLTLVYDLASLLALYHRRQPTADVRSILYSAGLLLRRRRGTKAGRRRIRSATGVRVVTLPSALRLSTMLMMIGISTLASQCP